MQIERGERKALTQKMRLLKDYKKLLQTRLHNVAGLIKSIILEYLTTIVVENLQFSCGGRHN
jgi:hypothetical protein